MIDVMTRLAELDASNPRVEKKVIKQELNGENAVTGLNKYTGEEVHEHISVSELRKLSGLTESVNECGPMGMPGMIGGMESPMGGMAQRPPANFSINASAADGHEVAAMLSDILNLAGVKELGPKDIGAEEPHGSPLTGEPPMMGGGDSDIKKALDTIDQIEDEEATGFEPNMGGEEGEIGMNPAMSGGDGEPDVQDMVSDIEDMTDTVKQTDKADLDIEEANRIYDNSPQEHNRTYDPNDFAQVINKIRDFDIVPARGGDNPLKAHATEAVESTDDTGSLAEKLMSDYQQFINEGNQKVDKISEMSPGKYAAVHKRAVARGNDASQSGDEDEADRQYAKASVASHLGNERRKSAQMKKGVNPNH